MDDDAGEVISDLQADLIGALAEVERLKLSEAYALKYLAASRAEAERYRTALLKVRPKDSGIVMLDRKFWSRFSAWEQAEIVDLALEPTP